MCLRLGRLLPLLRRVILLYLLRFLLGRLWLMGRRRFVNRCRLGFLRGWTGGSFCCWRFCHLLTSSFASQRGSCSSST